jgi:large subunit ribosomal protein L9
MVKVILREHVENLGERGEIVSVAPGYARNYLLPKKLAFEATPGNLKQLEQERRVWAARDAKEVGEAEALAATINAVQLSTVKKAGESGTLYGSVTSAEIAEMLAGKGIEVDRKRILLDEPIKALGSYQVKVKIHRKVEAQFALEVVGEEESD